ncbi:MAG: hypothetical protein AAF378_08255 [Cyanobacteria bacterium P01_A01_bin.84]
MSFCKDRSRAIVKINGEIAHISKLPEIFIEVEPFIKCQDFIVEYYLEDTGYFHAEEDGYTWNELSGIFYGPIGELRTSFVPFPDGHHGYKVELYCYGDWRSGCLESPEWYELATYSNARIKSSGITDVRPRDDEAVANSYTLRIINRNGDEEFLQIFDEFPEYEVICGCNIYTEVECKSDNKKGFCCIPCNEIVSKLNALKNKL